MKQTKEQLATAPNLSIEDLKTYQLAQKLRSAANRVTRYDADVAMLCEHALSAAAWLERESVDFMQNRFDDTNGA